MTTRFEIIRYTKATGEIETETTWGVYDCEKQIWTTKPPVVLRNILLAALYPLRVFTIGEIDKYKNSGATALNPFTVHFTTTGDKQVLPTNIIKKEHN